MKDRFRSCFDKLSSGWDGQTAPSLRHGSGQAFAHAESRGNRWAHPATPAGTFEGRGSVQNVSDGVANPVTLVVGQRWAVARPTGLLDGARGGLFNPPQLFESLRGSRRAARPALFPKAPSYTTRRCPTPAPRASARRGCSPVGYAARTFTDGQWYAQRTLRTRLAVFCPYVLHRPFGGWPSGKRAGYPKRRAIDHLIFDIWSDYL